MAGSLVPIGNTLLVLVSPPVTKCWRIQYRLGGTGRKTGTNRGFPTGTKGRFSSGVNYTNVYSVSSQMNWHCWNIEMKMYLIDGLIRQCFQ